MMLGLASRPSRLQSKYVPCQDLVHAYSSNVVKLRTIWRNVLLRNLRCSLISFRAPAVTLLRLRSPIGGRKWLRSKKTIELFYALKEMQVSMVLRMVSNGLRGTVSRCCLPAPWTNIEDAAWSSLVLHGEVTYEHPVLICVNKQGNLSFRSWI